MKVLEVFKSIQGEGTHRGEPMVFIRLGGCNLRCTFCDTAYAQPLRGWKLSYTEVLKRVQGLARTGWVYITGGEPLIQEKEVYDLVSLLNELDYSTAIATNGSLDKPSWYRHIDMWNVDIKCPSSGMCGQSKLLWFESRPKDEIKFVVSNEEDLNFVVSTLDTVHNIPKILISPMIDLQGPNQVWLQKVWDFCVKNNLLFSLQEHKIVWANKRLV